MLKRKAGALIVFVVAIVLWFLVDITLDIKEIILPNPLEISYAIIGNLWLLTYNTFITMTESILGFIFGSLLGMSIAIIFVYSNNVKEAVYPYMIALKATPLFALAPLLVIWFGNGMMSKTVMSALVAFFPVLVSSVKGFTAIDRESIDLFRSLNATKVQIFKKLRFPSALPYIFPSLKVATTLAVVGATIAEFTGSSAGIGHLIINSTYYLETSLMFGAVIFISVAGILFFYLIEYIEKKVVFWQEN